MGSGKLKDKNQTEAANGKSNLRKSKPNKLDTIRFSGVDNLKMGSDKASESLATFLNIKENERPIKESTLPITEEETSMYRTLIQTQKSRFNEEGISPNKKQLETIESARNLGTRDLTSDRQLDRQVKLFYSVNIYSDKVL